MQLDDATRQAVQYNAKILLAEELSAMPLKQKQAAVETYLSQLSALYGEQGVSPQNYIELFSEHILSNLNAIEDALTGHWYRETLAMLAYGDREQRQHALSAVSGVLKAQAEKTIFERVAVNVSTASRDEMPVILENEKLVVAEQPYTIATPALSVNTMREGEVAGEIRINPDFRAPRVEDGEFAQTSVTTDAEMTATEPAKSFFKTRSPYTISAAELRMSGKEIFRLQHALNCINLAKFTPVQRLVTETAVYDAATTVQLTEYVAYLAAYCASANTLTREERKLGAVLEQAFIQQTTPRRKAVRLILKTLYADAKSIQNYVQPQRN